MFNAWLPAPVFCSLWLTAVSCWAGQLHSAWDSCLGFHLWRQMTGLALHPTANVWARRLKQCNKSRWGCGGTYLWYCLQLKHSIVFSFFFLTENTVLSARILLFATMYGNYWCLCGDMKRKQAITNCIMDRKLAKIKDLDLSNKIGSFFWCHRCNNWDSADASLVPDIANMH